MKHPGPGNDHRHSEWTGCCWAYKGDPSIVPNGWGGNWRKVKVLVASVEWLIAIAKAEQER